MRVNRSNINYGKDMVAYKETNNPMDSPYFRLSTVHFLITSRNNSGLFLDEG